MLVVCAFPQTPGAEYFLRVLRYLGRRDMCPSSSWETTLRRGPRRLHRLHIHFFLRFPHLHPGQLVNHFPRCRRLSTPNEPHPNPQRLTPLSGRIYPMRGSQALPRRIRTLVHRPNYHLHPEERNQGTRAVTFRCFRPSPSAPNQSGSLCRFLPVEDRHLGLLLFHPELPLMCRFFRVVRVEGSR